jgi:VIT1/CCC1 family predicted Fe2+/Mn2+ transporter
MPAISLSQLVPILQLSIGPVILISGVGLLLLTLTNRFGRMVDRARLLSHELAAGPAAAKADDLRLQIQILLRRASILRLSITLGTITVLLAGVLVLLLFLAALLKVELGVLIVAVFCTAMLSLLGSMIAFIKDTNLALAAVRHEVRI